MQVSQSALLTFTHRKQSVTPALSSIMRNRRVQFLPVQWRTNFQLNADEERRREDAGLDNDFTLNGVSYSPLYSMAYIVFRHHDKEQCTICPRSYEQGPYRYPIFHEVSEI